MEEALGEVCYRFPDIRVAKASLELLARIEGVDEDTWEKMGICFPLQKRR